MLRDEFSERGGDPKLINPQVPVEMVIDHSVQIDFYGTQQARKQNTDLEFSRNEERYNFLKW
jgi:aconitate hydratase